MMRGRRYFTGVPCVNGHLVDRYVNGSTCVTCAKNRAAKQDPAVKRRRAKDWIANNKDRQRATQATIRDRHLTADRRMVWAKAALGRAGRAARAIGLPFDLSIEQVRSLCVDRCPVLGCSLVYVGKHMDWHSAQLDRRVPALGYVVGNVCVISRRANTIKNNASLAELVAICDWLFRETIN